jgi:hypothetical protein
MEELTMSINYDKTKLLKAKSIGEVAWLKMKNIEVIKEVQYERKRVFFFDDSQLQATNALKEYYESDYSKFADLLQDTRMYLFGKLQQD